MKAAVSPYRMMFSAKCILLPALLWADALVFVNQTTLSSPILYCTNCTVNRYGVLWWQQIPSRFHPKIMHDPSSEDPQSSCSKLAYRLLLGYTNKPHTQPYYTYMNPLGCPCLYTPQGPSYLVFLGFLYISHQLGLFERTGDHPGKRQSICGQYNNEYTD